MTTSTMNEDEVNALRERVTKAETALRAFWQKTLDEFIGAIEEIPNEPINVMGGPEKLELLATLESGLIEDRFGDLLPAAESYRVKGMEYLKTHLKKVALEIVNPDSVPKDTRLPVGVLELGLAALRDGPFNLDTVFGDEEVYAKGVVLKAECIKRMEALIERRKKDTDSIESMVERALDSRDNAATMHAIEDAKLTGAERAARNAAVVSEADALFKLARRITEIASLDEGKHQGAIDGDGLLEVVREANDIIGRIQPSARKGGLH